MSGHRPARRLAVASAAAAAAVAALLVHPGPAAADDTCTITWKGGTGAWADASRWSPARVPTSDDAACIVRAGGAVPVAVRVAATTTVASVTLAGATLAIAPDVRLFETQFMGRSATLTGGGTLAGFAGITELTDTRLTGAHVQTSGLLRLAGRITVSGGATAEQQFGGGGADLRPGVQVVDADGNPGNHLSLANSALYISGSVFVGVRLALSDTILFSQGEVTLASLDNLGDDGVLRPTPGTRTLQLGTGSQGTLRLSRSVTGVARGVSLFGDDIQTATGGDALRTVRHVEGTLGMTRRLFLDGPLLVRGRFSSSEPVSTTAVTVARGAVFSASAVDGHLSSAGEVSLASGARVGRLTLLDGALTTIDARTPLVVRGAATLGGSLVVPFGSGGVPAAGTTWVLLTAADGVTGRFTAVGTDRPQRVTVRAGYRPTFVTGTFGAAA